MYSQFKVAVAGTGFIGPVHIEALQRLGIVVKGVLGSSPAKGERIRQLHGLEKAYASFEEILADEAIHAVHLAVPNVLHFDMAKQALLAGKHVMCEKPLGMNTVETTELVALAKDRGLAAGVCYNIRFYPLNLEVRQRIQRGELGKVFAITGSYVQDWLLYETDYNWRVLAEKGGALRAVADIGTHWMDLVVSITGLEVAAVFADLSTVYPIRKRPKGEVVTYSAKKTAPQDQEDVPIDTEDCGSILFRFKGGGKGQLWVSQMTAGRKNCLRYEIAGTEKAVAWNSESPNELWIGHRNQPNALLLKDAGLLDPSVGPFTNYPGGHNEGFPDTFKQCFRAFYDAISEGIPAEQAFYPTFAEGHKEVALCEAILKSHAEERWVGV
ncbi:MAG: Gfo/Idh/MocA family oxidoreductase [Saprospiraceae bacterium]